MASNNSAAPQYLTAYLNGGLMELAEDNADALMDEDPKLSPNRARELAAAAAAIVTMEEIDEYMADIDRRDRIGGLVSAYEIQVYIELTNLLERQTPSAILANWSRNRTMTSDMQEAL